MVSLRAYGRKAILTLKVNEWWFLVQVGLRGQYVLPWCGGK